MASDLRSRIQQLVNEMWEGPEDMDVDVLGLRCARLALEACVRRVQIIEGVNGAHLPSINPEHVHALLASLDSEGKGG
jgi:hypothetical protein